MKKLLILSFVGLSLVGGSGCKKILDTKPQDFLTPENYFAKGDDAKAALGAAWQTLTKPGLYRGDYQFRYETADDSYTALSNAFPANLGVDASKAEFATRWNQIYQTIQYTNILLANLARTPMDEGDRKIVRGEGLFLRAFLYYELTKEWGDVPMRLTPTTDATDVNLAATPRKDIYTQVLKDLTEAEGLVPTTAVSGYGAAGYVAKTGVQAMLARVCLTMAGFPINDASKYLEAKTWAQKVVDSKEHALNPDFTQVFKNYANNVFDKKESLWEIDFNSVNGNNGAGGYIGYLDGIQNNNVAFGGSVGQVGVTRKLILSYGPFATAGDKDKRRDWTCSTFSWKNTNSDADIEANKSYWTSTQLYNRRLAKFRLYYCPLPNTVNGATPINWPVIRYSDVLLMLAEAENQVNGPTALAYSCINQVRARAYGKLMPGATNLTEADEPPGMTKDQFLAEVQNERMRELAGEALRKQDLIRWGLFVTNVKGLLSDILDTTAPAQAATSGTTTGQPYYVVLNLNTVSDKHLLFPIPSSELQYNKLLKQNPGW